MIFRRLLKCKTQQCYESSVASRKDRTFKGLIYDLLNTKTRVLPVLTNGPLHTRLTKAGMQTHYHLLTLALPQKGTANTKIVTLIKGQLKGTLTDIRDYRRQSKNCSISPFYAVMNERPHLLTGQYISEY